MDAFAAFEATFPGQSCRQSLILRDHKGEIVPGYFQEFPRNDVHRCWSSDLRGNVESSSRVQEKCHSSRRSSEAFVEVDMPKKYTNLI